MNTIKNLLINLCNLLVCACELFRYALIFLLALFSPKAVLAARLLAVESQLAACKHQIGQRKRRLPRFTASFRLLWVLLSKSLDKWEDFVHLMQPATVKKWHNTAFRYFWRWKSRRKGGRPPISKEMQNLIYKLSKENPLWSAERIRDTLLLLNYDPPCNDTIGKYMYKPRKPRERSTTWLPFLRNHLDMSWAIDFFTVTTINFALDELGINYDDDLIQKLIKVYRNHIPKIALPDDSRDVLAELSDKYTLALLTNGFLPAQQLKVQALGIEKYFKCIIYTEQLGRNYWKPSPAGFEKLLKTLNTKAETTVYVADNEEKDFIAPNKLGMLTIQVIRPARIHRETSPPPCSLARRAAARHIIHELRQLPVLLAEL